MGGIVLVFVGSGEVSYHFYDAGMDGTRRLKDEREKLEASLVAQRAVFALLLPESRVGSVERLERRRCQLTRLTRVGDGNIGQSGKTVHQIGDQGIPTLLRIY